MTNTRIFKLDGYEKTPLPILARIYKSVPGVGKVAIQQADLTGITRTVRRFGTVAGQFGNVTQPETCTALVIPSSIFNTLQTDNSWWKDGIGYNFADTIPAASFPGLGAYSIVYTFTPSGPSFSIFPFVVRANMVSLQGTLVEG